MPTQGGNDEVEQPLNQMLACMDGLESNENGVVVMAATNRVDILDQARSRGRARFAFAPSCV